MLGLVFADTVRPDCAHEGTRPVPGPGYGRSVEIPAAPAGKGERPTSSGHAVMLGLVFADTVRPDCAHEEHAPFPVPLKVQVSRFLVPPPAYATAQPPPASPVMLGLVFADTVRPDCAHEEHAPLRSR